MLHKATITDEERLEKMLLSTNYGWYMTALDSISDMANHKDRHNLLRFVPRLIELVMKPHDKEQNIVDYILRGISVIFLRLCYSTPDDNQNYIDKLCEYSQFIDALIKLATYSNYPNYQIKKNGSITYCLIIIQAPNREEIVTRCNIGLLWNLRKHEEMECRDVATAALRALFGQEIDLKEIKGQELYLTKAIR